MVGEFPSTPSPGTQPGPDASIKKLAGYDDQYRLRAGDCRVIYEVMDGQPLTIQSRCQPPTIYYTMVEIWCNMRGVALNIKNEEVERLAAEVARMTGESKTEAVRRALTERRQRLAYRISPSDREGHALRFLEREVWPRIPEDQLGRRLSRSEEDEILGYGPEGV
jgi:antitoxin VapB